MAIIDSFTIPEEIAKNLTELMAKQAINDRILASVADQPEKYNNIMSAQIQIQRKIDEIKYKITDQYVPDQYRSDKYTWTYVGFDIAGVNVEIISNN